MWPLYVSTLCVTTLWEHSMCGHANCDHSVGALYVWPLYVSTLCGTILCEHSMCGHSMCDHSMCGHSMWALYVWSFYVSTLCVSTLCVTTLCVTTLCEHSMCEHSMRHHSMWAERYENYHENSTSVLGPDVAAPKTSKKHEFYCKNPVQEHCRTPKSTRITTKNEHRRSWRAEKARKFTDETRFRPFQEHCPSPQSTRITTKNEHRRSREAGNGNYENLQTKAAPVGRRHPKTTKIHRRTNMQARNHENSDEFRPTPLRHLDLDTPAFYYYRKNPKCYHTVWGTTHCGDISGMGPCACWIYDPWSIKVNQK